MGLSTRPIACAAAIVGLLCVASATASNANRFFVSNYGAWRALPPQSKEAYAAGAFDQLLNSSPSDAANEADARGVLHCAGAVGLTPSLLAEMVDRRYARHGEESSFAAAAVLAGAVVETCKAKIDEERRKSGLAPLD